MPSCGPGETCSDVESSIKGEILAESIKIDWETDRENADVGCYKLIRYTTNPASGTVVYTVNAAQDCGILQQYSYTDAPSTPLSQWKYQVRVWKPDNTKACEHSVTPT